MPTAVRRIRYWGLTLHGIVLAVPLVAFLVLALATSDGGGANIGAGIALLPVLGLGLPWSLPVLGDPDGFGPKLGVLWCLVAIGPALLNLALHVGIRAAVVHRRRS